MTTTITVQACCSDDKEVEVSLMNLNSDGDVTIDKYFLQNGQIDRYYVYDNRTISVREKVRL